MNYLPDDIVLFTLISDITCRQVDGSGGDGTAIIVCKNYNYENVSKLFANENPSFTMHLIDNGIISLHRKDYDTVVFISKEAYDTYHNNINCDLFMII